jgi:WhiB family redox-sensing transcriptional regulator
MSVQFASDSTDPFPSALCAQSDPELFFPEKGGSHKDAVKICNRCIHLVPCLEDALSEPIQFGIRGGTSESQRRKILQSRKKAVA